MHPQTSRETRGDASDDDERRPWVEDDWKRGVQDAAKHRAVKQLEGYDGFKNMVSVAHLRPYHAPNLKDHSGPAPPAFAFTPEGVHEGPGATVGTDGTSIRIHSFHASISFIRYCFIMEYPAHN